MAKLDPKPYPGDWEYTDGDTWESYSARTEALMKAIPTAQVVSFPWADSAAYYFVKSETPLVLQWIPYCDAWQVPDHYIRGFRLDDLVEHRRRAAAMAKMFGGKNA